MLIAIVLVLGSAGRRILVVGTPTAPELTNQGYIGVYLSDPEADVSFNVPPTDRHEGEELPGYRALRIDLKVKSREDPLWWAVALGGSARIPPNLLWGDAPGVKPFDEERAHYVNNVEGGSGADSVIFGSRKNEPEFFQGNLKPTEISMTLKVSEPVVLDAGEYVSLSTPTLGRNEYDEPPQIGGTIKGSAGQTERNPRQFENDEADPQLMEMLSQRTWYVPKRMQVSFNAELTGDHEFDRARQDAGTAPVAAFRKEWRATDTLKVNASFWRPSEARNNERWIFLAGVLISLAASFFVWALELLFGPERNPVAALRPRP